MSIFPAVLGHVVRMNGLWLQQERSLVWSEPISCWKEVSLRGGVSTQPPHRHPTHAAWELKSAQSHRDVGLVPKKLGKGPSLSSGGVRSSMHVSRQDGRHLHRLQLPRYATGWGGVTGGLWAGADEVEGGSCSSDGTACR